MSLTSTTTRVDYSGNGSTTVFPITFAFWSADDLSVINTVTATGVQTTWTRGNQFTVSGGSGSTGSLTATSAPASGTTLAIISALADTQPTALPAGGAFPSSSVEQQLDQTVRQIQQLAKQIVRSLIQPAGDTADISSLPAKVSRASMLLGFDTNGDPIAVSGSSGGTIINAAMVDVVQAASHAAALALLGSAAMGPVLSAATLALGRTAFGVGLSASPALIVGDGSGNITVDASFLRGYISGLTLSNNVGTPNTKIDVAAGACVDDGNATLQKFTAGTIDCGTTGANGLDAGSLANSTWYHVFAITKAAGAVPVFLASTSVSSPTMPSNYTLKRRIGSFRTDGSAHILAFSQNNDEFLWSTGVRDMTTVTTSATASLVTLTVPTGVKVTAKFHSEIVTVSGTPGSVFTSPDESDQAAANGFNDLLSNVAGVAASGSFERRTNTSAQIRVRSNGATGTLELWTFGWNDSRGRFA